MSKYREVWNRLNWEYIRRVKEEGETDVEDEIDDAETDFAVDVNWLREICPEYERTKQMMIRQISK
tara:strand:+ start:214 stop:411 length:198 start_codon:yes stop_codon:yes gene_type:complete